MSRALIIFASNNGHKGRIAERLGTMLTGQGMAVEPQGDCLSLRFAQLRKRRCGIHQGKSGHAGEFFSKTGWTAGQVELVAGCIQYPSYNFVEKFMMKRIAKDKGLPLDASQEHEYTDWGGLESFARDFALRSAS